MEMGLMASLPFVWVRCPSNATLIVLIIFLWLISDSNSFHNTQFVRHYSSRWVVLPDALTVPPSKTNNAIYTTILGSDRLEIPSALINIPSSILSNLTSRFATGSVAPKSASEVLKNLQDAGPFIFRWTKVKETNLVHEWALRLIHTSEHYLYTLSLQSLLCDEAHTVSQLIADLVYFHHQRLTGNHQSARVLLEIPGDDAVMSLQPYPLDDAKGNDTTFWISAPSPSGAHHVLAPVPIATLPAVKVLHTKIAAIVGTNADIAAILRHRPGQGRPMTSSDDGGYSIDWRRLQATEEAWSRQVWQQIQSTDWKDRVIVEVNRCSEFLSPWLTLARVMQHQFGINLHHSSSSLQPPPTRPAQRSLDDLHRQSKQLTKQLRQMRQARSDLRGSSSSSSALRDAITRCEASIRTLEQQNAELVERQHCPQQQAMDGLYPIVTRLQPILIQAASDEGEKEEEGSYWLHLFLVETSGKPGS